MGVHSCAHGRTSQADFTQKILSLANDHRRPLQCGRIGGKLLPQPNRHRVHHVSAPGFQNVIERFGFAREGSREFFDGGYNIVENKDGSQSHGRGENVVCRLAEIHVIVRVDCFVLTALLANKFERAIGDNFIGVHVERNASPGLIDVHNKFTIKFSLDHFIGGSGDRGSALCID